ncbi:MAG TPA: GNAT family N-acetyltransferase [Ignavibacteria bacterium]|nr:N-acetyltransferase [Bacteroidota bacterium]HRE09580.1 GNAT family N-acetyltransferase [Ignavibacteria bacterium]HRF64401.1 GNAT family N-acetyltransferase [Ignavibacteria bacterium]
MKILETERLTLRNQQPEDADVIAKMFGDAEVMRFIADGKTLPRSAAEQSISNWNDYERTHGFTSWAVVRREDGALIGKCGFNYLPDKSDIELSYMLDEPYWGNGYATEIAKATLEYGMNKLGLKRVVAIVYPQNSPSIRVIEKSGMKYEKEYEYMGIKMLMYAVEK